MECIAERDFIRFQSETCAKPELEEDASPAPLGSALWDALQPGNALSLRRIGQKKSHKYLSKYLWLLALLEAFARILLVIAERDRSDGVGRLGGAEGQGQRGLCLDAAKDSRDQGEQD